MLPLDDNRRSQLKSVKCHIDEYERGKVEGLREEGEYSIIIVYAIVHDAVTKWCLLQRRFNLILH